MYFHDYPPASEAQIRAQVRNDRLQLLFRQSFFSVFGSALAAVMLSWICWERLDHSLITWWLSLLGGSTALRLIMLITYFQVADTSRTPERWEPTYWVTLVLSAGIWGGGALVLMQAGDLLIQTLVLLFTVGMSVSAVSCYSAYRSMTLVSIALVLLPCSTWLLMQAQTAQLGMAMASLIFAGFVVSATHKLSQAMEKAFRLSREMEHAHRIAVHAAQTDELTGLQNRRAFFHRAEGVFETCKQAQLPLCVLMLDIDHFKRINDSHGHQAGDEVLRQIGRVIRQSVRDADVSGRLGGEEFALVLANTSIEGARIIAERLRWAIADIPCQHDEGVTASLGVAALNHLDQDLHALLALADKAMFRAKASGRNQTAVAR
jgi:diguanylate cyclase (GGDEF)-like protein